jgi:hypothetical protein
MVCTCFYVTTGGKITPHRQHYSVSSRNDYLRSVSGTLDVMEELVEVSVVTDGGRTGNDSPESHFCMYLIDKITFT